MWLGVSTDGRQLQSFLDAPGILLEKKWEHVSWKAPPSKHDECYWIENPNAGASEKVVVFRRSLAEFVYIYAEEEENHKRKLETKRMAIEDEAAALRAIDNPYLFHLRDVFNKDHVHSTYFIGRSIG